jgi:hypothetical protein
MVCLCVCESFESACSERSVNHSLSWQARTTGLRDDESAPSGIRTRCKSSLRSDFRASNPFGALPFSLATLVQKSAPSGIRTLVLAVRGHETSDEYARNV